MTITASKFLAAIFNIALILIVTIPLCYYLPFINLETMQAFEVALGLALVLGLMLTIASNEDVEIDEDNLQIGGSAIFNKRKSAVLLRFRAQQFISKDELDISSTQNRRLWEKVLGEYSFYDNKGRGFKIKRYLFSAKDFALIKSQIQSIYDIEIS